MDVEGWGFGAGCVNSSILKQVGRWIAFMYHILLILVK
jgi:hypothetical protein